MTALSPLREPVFDRAMTPKAITDDICRPLEGRGGTGPGWWIGFLLAAAALGVGLAAIGYEMATGIGTWGLDKTVGWAFDIVNFVFWVGIGHAGTLISAILFLFRQTWRTGINRFAEAMTIFAVVCAAMFPGIHVGRPWLAYWLFPVPNQMDMWPQFRSPLLWDVFAVSTYASVSLLFWYIGMIPDLATLRDRATSRTKQIMYGIFSVGWTGSCRHWHRFEKAYLILAGLCTPLVLSVHSVVSSDFAITILPGWHSTIFPPYFVAGAIFSGFCMVATLMIPIRRVYGLQNVITKKHIDNVCKMILVTGLIVDYSYLCEFYLAWYSGEHYEMWTMLHALGNGPNGWAFWYTMFSNVVLVQVLWSKSVRSSELVVWVVTLFINVGMWTERFSIIALSLQQDFLPSSWAAFHPSPVDWGLTLGTGCFFAFLFLLFLRFIPFVPVAELKELKSELKPRWD
jgi:Ni/Fe-hydrogenase subunit HybB-like protein